MTKRSVFSGLIVDEHDNIVEVVYVGDEPCYVVDDAGFRRHIPTEQVDRKVFELMTNMIEGHEDLIFPAEKVLKFIQGYMKLNKNLNTVVLENPFDVNALLESASISYDLEFYEMVLDFCNYLLEIEPDNNNAQKLLKEAKKHNPAKFEWIKNLIDRAARLEN